MAARRRGRRKRKKTMDSKSRKLLLGIAGGSAGVLLLSYIGVGIYYSAHFLPNTEINGHDCSGKTASQVESVFKEEMKEYTLTITGKDGRKEEITSEDISLEYKESKEMKAALKEQSSFLWPASFFSKDSAEVTVDLSYDSEKLEQKLNSLQAVTAEQVPPQSAYPEFNGEKYVVHPETYGTAIDPEVLKEKAATAIRELDPELNLMEDKCYAEPKYTSDCAEVVQACKEMDKYCQASITYPMDVPVVVDGNVISTWLSLDEEMNVSLNEEAVRNWLTEFGDKYDTMGAERTFTTPTGKTATVSGGDYGWSIDEDTEYTVIMDALANGEVLTREPAYYAGGTAASHGMPDWGATYAEVDLTEQHMWYVIDGAVALESDVVTGLPTPDRITPTGVYVFKEKALNATLIGDTDPSTGQPSYRTPVDYWMRITWEGVGFHDAKWQPAFGGELYRAVGSHGCVNMPVDKAAALYDLIQEGVPVIIHN